MEKGRIDWNAVRAEYIGGKASFRSLAEKYGIGKDTVARRAKAENWSRDRETARDKTATESIQKIADSASDNAVIAARIREKLLRRIEREIDALPEDMGTEYRECSGPNSDWVRIRRLKDLTASLKDLTTDQQKTGQAEEALKKAWEILGGVQSAIQ